MLSSRVALVTDSTSGLPPSVLAEHDITCVPLHVIIGEDDYAEGVDITGEEFVARLRKSPKVSTSRPSPRAFLQVYEALAARGAHRVLSVHLSAQMSGTCEAATLAARDASVPVRVVDSGQAGAGLGYAVLAAAQSLRAAGAGGGPPAGGQRPASGADGPAGEGAGDACGAAVERAAGAAERSAAATMMLFYVHTLDFLRRGGRIGAASAFLGGALAIKPLLELADGHIEPVEKLRTQGRALARLVDLALAKVAGYGSAVQVAVHHVDAAARAAALAERLAAGLRPLGALAGEIQIVPLPSVLAAHVGPGALGAVIAPGPGAAGATRPAGEKAGDDGGEVPGRLDPPGAAEAPVRLEPPGGPGSGGQPGIVPGPGEHDPRLP